MTDFSVLEPSIDPNNRMSFLIDWEVTMKCNLNCDYCPSGLFGGHDNSLPHPALDRCIEALHVMYEYADLYMQSKPRGLRYVVLNVYGGESLHHPEIVEILQTSHRIYKQKYHDRWHLTITTTTNAIVNKKKLAGIIPLIDEFTVSYHTNNTGKQKELFKSNILDIAAAKKRLKCVILMHPQPDLFADAQQMIAWCDNHGVRYLSKPLDGVHEAHGYQDRQIDWFQRIFDGQTLDIADRRHLSKNPTDPTILASQGRICCGGRSVCKDQSYKNKIFFVENKFPDWFCSVNEFFCYVKQVTGDIYVNKDCKMNFHGAVGPIGNLSDPEALLTTTRQQLQNKKNPSFIQCKKSRCLCGLCAPKARFKQDFEKIMEKYRS